MSHSFLKESKLYIVYGTNKYRIYTSSAISFSQTFAQDSYPVKTLHDQSKMFEETTITTANPADFSFDIPFTEEKDERYIINLIPQLTSGKLTEFDIYVQTERSVFKLESAVITSADFDISPNEQFTARLQGVGKKLERVANYNGTNWRNIADDANYTIPGSEVSGSAYSTPTQAFHELSSRTRTPLLVYPVVSIDSLNMNSIMSTTVQIQNNMDWIAYETLQESLAVINNDVTTLMRPSDYTVENKVVSGAIRQYQTDDNITQFDDFSTTSTITIKAVQIGKPSNDNGYFTFVLNPASFTARMETAEVFTQSYDYRSLDQTPTIAYV
jgi:hypothetical protein